MKRLALWVGGTILACILLSLAQAFFIEKNRTVHTGQIVARRLKGIWKSRDYPVTMIQKVTPSPLGEVPMDRQRVQAPLDPDVDGITSWYIEADGESRVEMVSYQLSFVGSGKKGSSREYVLKPYSKRNDKWVQGRSTEGVLGRARTVVGGHAVELQSRVRGGATAKELTLLREHVEVAIVDDVLGGYRHNTIILHRHRTDTAYVLLGILVCAGVGYYVWKEHRNTLLKKLSVWRTQKAELSQAGEEPQHPQGPQIE